LKAAASDGKAQMDKTQFTLALLGSAVVGALFSSLVIAFSQWRERVAKRKELLPTFSVDLAKAYTVRLASSKGNASLLEMAAIPRFHQMLSEIFETGELSEAQHQFVMNHLDELDARATERVSNVASALRESRESKG
jgi:hypothetical protein